MALSVDLYQEPWKRGSRLLSVDGCCLSHGWIMSPMKKYWAGYEETGFFCLQSGYNNWNIWVMLSKWIVWKRFSKVKLKERGSMENKGSDIWAALEQFWEEKKWRDYMHGTWWWEVDLHDHQCPAWKGTWERVFFYDTTLLTLWKVINLNCNNSNVASVALHWPQIWSVYLMYKSAVGVILHMYIH